MLSYLLELTICWTVLYALYAIALRKETFFKGNRAYLLFALLVGMIIPLLEWPKVSSNAAENAVVYLQEVVIGGVEAVEITAQQTQISSSLGLTDVLLYVYFAGVILFGIRFSYGLFQIKKLYAASEKIIYQKTKIALTSKSHSPFSFFNSLFIPQDFDFQDIDNQKIIEHERAHLTQQHTIDVLLLEVLSILFWCLAPIYFFKKSLRQIHEYLADAEVLKNTQKKQYGLLLLRQTHQGRMCLSLANHFNQSQLKKRIMMMTKKPSNSRALWKYLAVLPLCFLLVFAFANREGETDFSLFDLSQSEFNPVTIKKELHQMIPIREIAFEEARRKKAFKKLFERFDELMMEYPTYRNEIKMIAEDVTNEKGIAVAFEREENSKDLYSMVRLDTWNRDTIYKDEGEYPRFPGCENLLMEERKDCAREKMNAFIYSNISYPAEAYEKEVEGEFVIKLLIGEDGLIKERKLNSYFMTSPDDEKNILPAEGNLSAAINEFESHKKWARDAFNEEMMKMVDKMPKWIPGKKDGKKIAYNYYLPVNFKIKNPQTDPVYKEVDEMPRFPGCEEKPIEERKNCAQHEMLMFIYKNIKYPEEARDKGVQGTVVTKFVIGADGKIRDAKIVREVGSGCDEAVLEIIAQMPNWIPGKKDGKNVAVEYHLPVKFKLEDNAKTEEEPKRPEECFVKGLELKDLSIAPNPTTGTFRVKFSAEKKPIIVVVSDMEENLLYSKEIKDFSGLFDEEITVKTNATTANIIIMQDNLMHTSRIAIVK